MKQAEYLAHDGVGLAKLVASGEVSRREVIHAAIASIEQLNPGLNAVIRFNDDILFEPRGVDQVAALSGVPFLLKDANLYSSDMPTTFGSKYFRGASPKKDSVMVERWRRAGLTILGKTNTPEFAAEFVTEPAAFGPTINPTAPELTVGGSSGGAAAAVAAGMVPIAHATDLGGSIRIPAACCGVFGFKPTAGLNPVGPYFKEIAGGLNSDHVITRSVRDSAASLDITADKKSGQESFLESLSYPPSGVRIGVTDRDPSGLRVGKHQQLAVARAAAIFEQLGHDIVEYKYPAGLTTEWFDYLWIQDIVQLVAERSCEIGREPLPNELEPLTWQLMEKARAGGLEAFAKAQLSRMAYSERYLSSLSKIDILLSPTLASDPLPLGKLAFTSFDSVFSWNGAGYAFAPFSIPANISGQPSASCPWLKSADGLSVGVQLNGMPGKDLLVLQMSAQLEFMLA